MTAELILIGGGGHCRACVDVIEEAGEYRIAGVVDRREMLGQEVLGYPVVATDDDYPSLSTRYSNFLITIGQVRTAARRRELFERVVALGGGFPAIVSPRAHVSRHADLGAGTIVMHHATVNASARVGANCIINTGATVEHDAVVGDHCHVATGAVVNGSCRLGDEVFVGCGAALFHGVSLTSGVLVSAGSVVRCSVTESGVFRGESS